MGKVKDKGRLIYKHVRVKNENYAIYKQAILPFDEKGLKEVLTKRLEIVERLLVFHGQGGLNLPFDATKAQNSLKSIYKKEKETIETYLNILNCFPICM